MEQTKATFPSTCASTFELAFAVAALQTQSEAPPQDHSNATNEKEQCQSGLEHDPNQDACQRLERSRERNREHARRTRLRKKAQLQALQSKVRDLEAERQTLKQSVEECSIASILLGLSNKEQDTVDMIDTSKEDERASKIALLSSCKRRRFVSDAGVKSEPITILIDGEETAIGNGRSQINWKTGLYTDDDGECKQLTSDQLESLRRERNRMHAKMTRDRKKNFIATIEQTIADLEEENARMRNLLSNHNVTPVTSPELRAMPTPEDTSEDTSEDENERPNKRPHGFSLDD